MLAGDAPRDSLSSFGWVAGSYLPEAYLENL